LEPQFINSQDSHHLVENPPEVRDPVKGERARWKASSVRYKKIKMQNEKYKAKLKFLSFNL
jgi:hypothetical protein